jgi:hypothetical protein
MLPETASVKAPTDNVPDPALPGLPNWILAHAEFVLTVTVNPLSIITTSPAIGKTPAPTATPPEVVDQVVFEFQFPVARE